MNAMLLNMDVLIVLFGFLDIEDLFVLSRVCRLFAKAARSCRIVRALAAKNNCDTSLEAILKTRISVDGVAISFSCRRCGSNLLEGEPYFPVFHPSDLTGPTCLVVGRDCVEKVMRRAGRFRDFGPSQEEFGKQFSCFVFKSWELSLRCKQYNLRSSWELAFSWDRADDQEDRYFDDQAYGFSGGKMPDSNGGQSFSYEAEESALFCGECNFYVGVSSHFSLMGCLKESQVVFGLQSKSLDWVIKAELSRDYNDLPVDQENMLPRYYNPVL